MSLWCDDPRGHRREGERDFERHGRYGYDSQKYHDSWDDCSKYYREGFDEARREQERQNERREEEAASERRAEHRAEHRRMEQRQLERQQEEEYYERQQQQQEPYPEQPQAEWIKFELMPLLGWSRKRRLKWCRQHQLKFNT